MRIAAARLLSRWRPRAQALPGVAHLMIMGLRQIIRRVERERLDVELADGAEQRVGGDHAIALRTDQPGFRRDQVGFRIQYIDGGALSALSLLLYPLQRHR